MKNDSPQEIWNKLKSSKKILTTLHKGPDGDSIGACAALKYILEKQGSEVTIVSPDQTGETLRRLEFTKEIEFGKSLFDYDIKEFDCVVFLDVGSEQMLAEKAFDRLKEQKAFIINIDHHETNEYFGNLNYMEAKSSACSVLINIFKEAGVQFDEELSTRLLLGVCTDTFLFRYRNPKESLKDATFLIDHGADYYGIVNPIFSRQPLRIKKYQAELISKMKTDPERKIGYTLITKEDIKKFDLNLTEIRMSASQLSEIEGIDIAFTLADLGNEIKGSLRSQTGVDVSKFAKELGGGGHKPAAGFVIYNTSLEEAEKIVLEKLKTI